MCICVALSVPNAAFSAAELSGDGEDVVFSATVQTKRMFLSVPSAALDHLVDGADVNFPSTGSYATSNVGRSDVSKIVLWVESAVATAIAQHAAIVIASVNVTACGDVCSAAAKALTAAALVINEPGTFITLLCPQMVCVNETLMVDRLEALGVSNYGSQLDDEDIESIAWGVATTLSLVTDVPFLEEMHELLQEQAVQIKAADEAFPRTGTFSASFPAGTLLPLKVRLCFLMLVTCTFICISHTTWLLLFSDSSLSCECRQHQRAACQDPRCAELCAPRAERA